MKKKYLECGKIVSTHGLNGEVKILHWCDSPEYICGFSALYMDNGAKKLAIERARPHKNMVIAKLTGIENIDMAAGLRGKILYIDRDDAPEDGAVFIQDLFGLDIQNADSGKIYGKLSNVIHTGANDVYEITGDSGKKLLIPAIPDVIKSVDMENGVMLITPLKGLFDHAD